MTVALAQATPPADASAAEVTAHATSFLRDAFRLSADLPIDAQLRASATEAASLHLKRTGPVIERWQSEERAHTQSGTHAAKMLQRIYARVINELALWQLEFADGTHEAALLRAALQPAACANVADRGVFERRVLLWQLLPPDQREAVLESERTILARWGQHDGAPPPRPVPSQQERLQTMIEQVKAGGTRPDVPLPPGPAAWLLRSNSNGIGEVQSRDTCSLNRWALDVAMRQSGSARDSAVLAFHYAKMPTAASWYPRVETARTVDSAEPGADYPRLATRFEVEGTITVEIVVDAQGRMRQAAVVARRVSVPGIRGVPPVAFETLLDEASLARAQKLNSGKPDAAQLTNGFMRRQVEFVWRLQ